MKRCVIVNPKAGAVKDVDALLRQIERLQPAAVQSTPEAGCAEAFAQDAASAGCDEIVVAGGDGTLNEAINGIMKTTSQPRVALVPLGTGNDFARCLELPPTIEQNIDIILSDWNAPYDVVRAQSNGTRYFVNVSAGGFSGLVDEKLTPEMKRTWGPLAYIRSAAAALPELRSYRTAVTLDDDEKLDVDLYNVVIANGRFVAGGLPIAPEADPRDGLLDVILIEKRAGSEMAVVAAQMLLGKHLPNEGVMYRRARRIAVQSTPGMWFNTDGELVGNEPVLFELMPAALHFVVPKK